MINWDTFFSLAKRVYQDDPFFKEEPCSFIQQLIEDNPFGAQIKVFQNSSSRLVGIIHKNFNVNDEKTAMFGFFEALDNDQDVKECFDQFEVWCCEKGINNVIGPINFSTFLPYRIRLNDFDRRPFSGEPYNKSYYSELLKKCGYEITQSYTSYKDKGFPDSFRLHIDEKKKAEEFLTLKGFSLHQVTEEMFKKHLQEFFFFVDATFKMNAYYHKIPDELFFSLYKGVAKKLDPNASLMVLDPDGKLAGFSWLFPDYSELKEREEASFKEHFDQLKNKTLLIKSVGVHPKYRQLNIFGYLMQKVVEYTDKNYSSLMACNMQDGGVTEKYTSAFQSFGKTQYALFTKKLS